MLAEDGEKDSDGRIDAESSKEEGGSGGVKIPAEGDE